MRREITLGQLLSVAMGIIISLATGWITQNNKVSKLEEQVRNMQTEMYNMQLRSDSKFDKIDNKLDVITNGISDLKERKADRK